ncbi:hypothetical protein ACR78H_25210 [Sphingobacterium siyangense]|uniref:hypothetical protein n=1 Tax=Sphingobacterium siyangense TaxID=459529 RepID=UPI003DA6A3D6
MSTIESKFNGYPAVTDWDKAVFLLQQANSQGFNGATKKEIAKELFGDISIQGADYEDLPVSISSAVVPLPIPEAEQKYGFLANGKFSQPNGPTLEYTAKQWGLVLFDGDKWVKKFTLDLPENPADGIIAEGNTNPISGNEAFKKAVLKSSIKNNSLIAPDSTYIINNTVINSVGGILTNASQYTNAKSIVGFPLSPNKTYTIGKFLASNGKNFALADSSGNVILAANLATLPKTFTTDATHTFLRCCVKQADNVEATDDNWKNTLMLVEGDALPVKAAIKEIEGNILEASTLSADNQVPTPSSSKNAVNLEYFNSKSLKKSELALKFSSNIAVQVLNETMIPHKFINNLGGISAGMYWMMYAFYPLKYGLIAGDSFVVHSFTITGGGYAAWYEGSVMRTYEGAINGLTPKVYTVPADATSNTILYFDTARPTDTGDNYAKLTINPGTVAIPYIEPKISVKTINGYTVEPGDGVTSFDKLTDVPKYGGNGGKVLKVKTSEDGLEAVEIASGGGDAFYNSITTNFLVVNNRPVWDEVSPTNLGRGQEYLLPDGNGNYFNKTKGL